jgi:two-component system response regulator HydG
LTKPFDVEVAVLALKRAVQFRRLRSDLKRLQEAADRSRQFGELLGGSPVMRDLQDLVERVRDSDVTVLITGESGTGKELVARTLHRGGKRSEGPFVAINCAALPETLLESELFGHAKGAFTDAKAARVGLFVQAEGGTLFLDEIGEMPPSIQAKLLRALQDRTVRPVGGSREIPFDARIVAATNRDLLAEVDEGRFREDLYFRLNVLEIPVPPLRARGRDILVLAERFIQQSEEAQAKGIRGLTPEAAQRLCDYHWPGNVRELQNCIQRAVALARYDQITVDDLPERIRDYQKSHVLVAAEDPTELVSLDVIERRYVLQVLEAVGGHRTTAAKILGLDRKTLYRKLERWGYGKDGAD